MKHLKLSLFVLLSFTATATFAQGKMQVSKIKQRLMTELKIDNSNADSVISIVQDFYTNARTIKTGALKDDEKKLALQKSRKEEVARLRSHLNDEQIKKLQGIMAEMKEEKQHRKTAKDSTASVQ